MFEGFKFNRMELAGSLGDFGTLLPIAIPMIFLNGLNPTGLFMSVGILYIFAGSYFGITVPVQPMKVIGAYAIATGMTNSQIIASSLIMGIFLMIIGVTGAINFVHKITPKSVIRGVQLSTGTLLISGGINFIIGNSNYQLLNNAIEPYLSLQYIGFIPISLIIGSLGGIITLLLLKNKKFPAALIIILCGFIIGIIFNTNNILNKININFSLPQLFPFNFPRREDFTFALFVLVLPQIPMTISNGVLAYTDLSKKYFGEKSKRVTNRKVCISMALGNFLSFCLGGMPICHGAGGLAAHYRFGAKTSGSNIIIGIIFVALALFFGEEIINLFTILPISILGILLIFTGSELSLSIMDLNNRKDYFIATLILGVTSASNLAVGFTVGMIFANILKWKKLSV